MKCRFCAAQFDEFYDLARHIGYRHPVKARQIDDYAYGDVPLEDRADEKVLAGNRPEPSLAH